MLLDLYSVFLDTTLVLIGQHNLCRLYKFELNGESFFIVIGVQILSRSEDFRQITLIVRDISRVFRQFSEYILKLSRVNLLSTHLEMNANVIGG